MNPVGAPGARNRGAKLTAAEVEEIHGLKGKLKRLLVARRYGVGEACIQRIWAGRSWRCLGLGPAPADRLSAAEVREIRAARRALRARLATRYAVTEAQIDRIWKGLAWRDVP